MTLSVRKRRLKNMQYKKVENGIIVVRGKNEIFVPEEFVKTNGKLKHAGKKHVEEQLKMKKKVG